MTPEERVNRYYWWVLQKIKEMLLTSPEGESIRYPPTHIMASGVPGKEMEQNILRKLEQMKILRIEDNVAKLWLSRSLPYYELTIFQQKFNTVYNEYKKIYTEQQPKSTDFNIEIDEWLNSKDDRTTRRIWQVVSALKYEWQLRDKETFNIPYDKFEREKISNVHDLEAILTTLHNKNFIFVIRKIGETPHTNNPDKPTGSLWATIVDKPEIIRQSDTQIKIIPQRFVYLAKKIEELVSSKNQKSPDTKIKKGNLTSESISEDSIPYCISEGSLGYLKFSKHGKKTKIGSKDSRHFRLLQCLFSPINVYKTVDSVFEAIRLPKDNDDSRLMEYSTSSTRKCDIISYAIKELQKGNKLEGKITVSFDPSKTKIKAVYSS